MVLPCSLPTLRVFGSLQDWLSWACPGHQPSFHEEKTSGAPLIFINFFNFLVTPLLAPGAHQLHWQPALPLPCLYPPPKYAMALALAAVVFSYLALSILACTLHCCQQCRTQCFNSLTCRTRRTQVGSVRIQAATSTRVPCSRAVGCRCCVVCLGNSTGD